MRNNIWGGTIEADGMRMRLVRLVVVGVAMALLQWSRGSNFEPSAFTIPSTFRSVKERAVSQAQAAASSALVDVSARDEVRRQVQEVIATTGVIVRVRYEVRESLKQARLVSREQARKLADEAKGVCRRDAKSGM